MATKNPPESSNPLLDELGIVSESDLEETVSVLEDALPPDLAFNPNIPVHSVIKTVVEEYAKDVFNSPQQARAFITNKLLEIATCGDMRHELRALELLGKLCDIAAFSEKSEVVVTAKSSADIDRQIREKVSDILQKRGVSLEHIIDAEIVETTPSVQEDELDEFLKQKQADLSEVIPKNDE